MHRPFPGGVPQGPLRAPPRRPICLDGVRPGDWAGQSMTGGLWGHAQGHRHWAASGSRASLGASWVKKASASFVSGWRVVGASWGTSTPSDLPRRRTLGKPDWAVHDGWTAGAQPGHYHWEVSGARVSEATHTVPRMKRWTDSHVRVFGPRQAGLVMPTEGVARSLSRLTHGGLFGLFR